MKRETRSRGIILKKHFPHKFKISLLDQTYGRLDVLPASWQWASYASSGAIIVYLLEEGDSAFFIKNIELEVVPVYTDELSILFMHHLLEVCYFGVPIQCGPDESFDFLVNVINSLHFVCASTERQKLLLAKFLFLIGQYPADIGHLTISSMLHKSFEYLLEVTLKPSHQKDLEIFIYHCIRFHPYGRLLKTVNFLSRVGE